MICFKTGPKVKVERSHLHLQVVVLCNSLTYERRFTTKF